MTQIKHVTTLVFIAAIQLGIACAGSIYIWHFNVSAEKDLLRNEAAVFAGHASQTALAASVVLDQVSERVLSNPQVLSEFDEGFVNRWALRIADIPQIRSVAFTTADGILINDAVIRNQRRIDLSDRDYFIQAKAQGGKTIVSEPIYSRSRDSWVIVMAKGLFDDKGTFIGLVLLGIEPNYFLEFFSSASDLNVALLSEKGAISAARFLEDSAPPIGQLLDQLPEEGTAAFAEPPFMGDGMMSSLSVPGWPWTVVVHHPTMQIIEKVLMPIIALALMTIAAMAVSLFLILGLQRRERQLERKNGELQVVQSKLERLVSIDPLTQILNRKGYFEGSELELKRCRRYDRPISVVSIDIDHFKKINDAYGHATGDEALRIFAQVTRELIRDTDVFGRIGGEEFAITLPETPIANAEELCRRILTRISQHPIWPTSDPDHPVEPINITISIGLAGVLPEEAFDDALVRSDKALYKVKESGRNGLQVAA